jgi:hypothetical protein
MLQFMPSASPSSSQANTPGKRSLTVDVGVATIIAALIVTCGSVAGGVLIGRATAPRTTPTSTTPKEANGPATATITPPPTGDIPYFSTPHGHVANLQRGQLVWTFFQPVNANGSFGATTYPTAGPCAVNFASGAWTCRDAYIGKPKDTGIYRVCVAILSFSQAYAVVKLIENSYATKKMDLPYWFAAPPPYIHDDSAACTSDHRIN